MTGLDTNRIITGDCLDVLAELPENSVHCVMTSPPYWNLRDYDHADQLGREETAEEFVQNITDVMDKVGRVLRDDGSLWLNLGDTYDNKDLQQIPARVAIECQNRGWILRNDVTWLKPGGGMPHSTADRLTCETEDVFHFVRQKEYYYDMDEIRENFSDSTLKRMGQGYKNWSENYEWDSSGQQNTTDLGINKAGVAFDESLSDGGKNPGDVFEVTVKPFPDAHFAVYPPELCEKPIKATCPENGIVLDPFAGAGTTCLKAKELDRRFIGIELNPEYADMARARVGLSPHNPANVRDNDDQQGLEHYAHD